jgi:beta-glucosidase/6-phospho-beta-glucosidase/beta-galactosidase
MTRWHEDGTLRFAVGFEDTFVPQVRPGERPLDEYELTQHYRFWHEDLGHAEESGATIVRWGIPWYLVQPAPDAWDWEWLDRAVDRFEELGLEVVVDLMHYGTPLWLEDEFANPGYPEAVARYASAVAERYRGRLRSWTPLNEPMLTILHCGEFGYWPPHLHGDDGFVRLLRAVARGIVLSQGAILAVEPDATIVHVEASFRFDGDLHAYAEQVDHLRHRAFLVEDLVTGQVSAAHPLAAYLAQHGFTENDFAWFQTNTAWPHVMGVNYYPNISTERFEEGVFHTGGPVDIRPRMNSWTEGMDEVLTAYAERYGRPVLLSETCWTGTVQERIDWLEASVASVLRLRDRGVPVVGYTWWAVIDMVEWTYRHGEGGVMDYMLAMGLWDLVEDEDGALRRVRNAVADRFRELATDGA